MDHTKEIKEIYEKVYSKKDRSPDYENILLCCEHCQVAVTTLSDVHIGTIAIFSDRLNASAVAMASSAKGYTPNARFSDVDADLFNAVRAVAMLRPERFIEITDYIKRTQIFAELREQTQLLEFDIVVFEHEKQSYIGFSDNKTNRTFPTCLTCEIHPDEYITVRGLENKGVSLKKLLDEFYRIAKENNYKSS